MSETEYEAKGEGEEEDLDEVLGEVVDTVPNDDDSFPTFKYVVYVLDTQEEGKALHDELWQAVQESGVFSSIFLATYEAKWVVFLGFPDDQGMPDDLTEKIVKVSLLHQVEKVPPFLQDLLNQEARTTHYQDSERPGAYMRDYDGGKVLGIEPKVKDVGPAVPT